ncbi:hypothetical protein [Streptomyces sp. NPDC088785]|uniref:hypothetical protein n=1 Tax=Streptomyces sp. NPDC088785 TaxID=3365897 RepID=UPI003830AD24
MTFRDPQGSWWARVFAARRDEKKPSPPRRRPGPLPEPHRALPGIPRQRAEPPI